MDEYESLSHSKWECKYHVVSEFGFQGLHHPADRSLRHAQFARCEHKTQMARRRIAHGSS